MRCSSCGYHVRGKNHTEGTHHQQGNQRLKEKAEKAAKKKAAQEAAGD